MNTPEMKRNIGISKISGIYWVIWFYASDEYAEMLHEFGTLEKTSVPNNWRLDVDRRFDFDEVMNYIESLG